MNVLTTLGYASCPRATALPLLAANFEKSRGTIRLDKATLGGIVSLPFWVVPPTTQEYGRVSALERKYLRPSKELR